MRFDILDEYSTLVPFGFGGFKQNRVVQYPAIATEAVTPGAMAKCVGRVKLWLKFAKLGHIKGREGASECFLP